MRSNVSASSVTRDFSLSHALTDHSAAETRQPLTLVRVAFGTVSKAPMSQWPCPQLRFCVPEVLPTGMRAFRAIALRSWTYSSSTRNQLELIIVGSHVIGAISHCAHPNLATALAFPAHPCYSRFMTRPHHNSPSTAAPTGASRRPSHLRRTEVLFGQKTAPCGTHNAADRQYSQLRSGTKRNRMEHISAKPPLVGGLRTHTIVVPNPRPQSGDRLASPTILATPPVCW